LGVALAGLIFIVLIGWRLIPVRRGQAAADDLFEVEKYITEVRLPEDAKLVGKRLSEINGFVENGVNILGLVRNGERRLAPSPRTVFQAGDILVLQIDTENLETLVAKARLELVGSARIVSDDLQSDEVRLMEAVVVANSLLVGETAFSLDLRRRHGVNLLAVSRQGRRLRVRLDRIRLRAGDVVLLQCPVETAKEALVTLGCLPLAQRDLRIGQPQQLIPPLAIFGSALLFSAVGLIPVQIAFVAAVVILVMAGFVSLREAYDSIDWPIIILLGAMIPVWRSPSAPRARS
jgi:di/tricarboxylate transporter